MAKKSIQLRGISRTPSDRMNSDGGVAESLNFQIDNTENVPILPPKAIESVVDGEVIYMHKGNGFENLIVREGENVYAYNVGEETPFLTDATADIKIAALGNVLQCIYNGQTVSVLFKNGAYKRLGGTIPFPELKFDASVKENADVVEFKTSSAFLWSDKDVQDGQDTWFQAYMDIAEFDESYWNDIPKELLLHERKNEWFERLKSTMSKIWGSLDNIAAHNQSYFRPVLARYSITLVDGTEIVSDPVFIGMKKEFMPATVTAATRVPTNLYNGNTYMFDTDVYDIAFSVDMANTFDIMLKRDQASIAVLNELKENWSDLVKGVNVYLSQDITSMPVDNYVGGYVKRDTVNLNTGITIKSRTDNYTYKVNSAKFIIEEPEIDEDVFLNKMVFNKVAEYSLDELIAENKTLEYFSNTDRAVKLMLKDSTIQSKDSLVPSGIKEYNGRLLTYGMTITPYHGLAKPAGFLCDESDMAVINPMIRYRIRGDLGSVVRTPAMSIPWRDYSCIASYLYYPDPNCFMAEISYGGLWYEVTMRPHPLMNGAYFLDTENMVLPKLLDDVGDGLVHSYVKVMDEYVPTMDSTFVYNNKLYQTSYRSFYSYEASLVTNGNILGVTVNTQALSAGQHGQHPVIVFTDNGLQAVEVDSTGALLRSDPLPREVAIEGKMWQVDDATVFVTDQGVKLIAGSQVVELSPSMNGRHYAIEQCARDVMEERMTEWLDFDEVLTDTTAFINFAKGSEMAYDYAAQRLIFFNKDQEYAYVYMMKTQTWHKLTLPYGEHFSRVLNSYPEAIVQTKHSGRYTLYNYTSFLDPEQSEDRLKGIIITRSLSLDNLDVHKTIKDIRIRGDYERYEVKEETTQSVTTITRVPSAANAPSGGIGNIISGELTESGAEVDGEIGQVTPGGTIEEDTPGTSESVDEVYVSQVMIDRWYEETGVSLDLKQMRQLLEGDIDEIKLVGVEAEKAEQLVAAMNTDAGGNQYQYTVEENVTEPASRTSNVRYMLLGSQDGLHFSLISSLRGKSWKFFRLIILAKLKPTEHISWIDVEYETRFTNRFR